jgi:hypothetical protein
MAQDSTDPRIHSMFSTDRMWAYFAVLVLWALYAFVFLQIMPHVNDEGVLIALTISGGLVVLFNTAAIVAMINHYAEDKEHIYGLDLRYLDIMQNKKD